MHRHQRQLRTLRSGAGLAFVLASATVLGLAPRASHAQSPCATGFKEQMSGPVRSGDTLCATAANKKCTFQLSLCINESGDGCTPQNLKKRTVHASGRHCGGVGKLKVKAMDTSSACGAFTGVTVKTKKHGTKAGTCKIRARAKKSTATLTLTCQPQPGSCPTTTTPTTTTTTTTLICLTTTTLPTCGNGVVDSGEQCDPPCSSGQCGSGQFCNSSCQCVPTAACTCGTSTKLDFTTDVGVGNCGAIGNSGGGHILCLSCGGLYFGGGADAVPLPAQVPDMGSSLTKLASCSDTCLTLGNFTSTETGSNRNCTSVGCLFGPPLPIPNSAAAPLSTCVINTVAKDAQGFAQCSNGAASLSLPLTSTIFLYGDLLNGSTPDRPDVPGIQPCPICKKACKVCASSGASNGMACTSNADCGAGGFCGGSPCAADSDCPAGISCSAAPQCLGGPNDGVACAPGSGSLGDPYPTSHDCPPLSNPPQNPIGNLPIPFALTTGISSKIAVASGTEQRVFCGFCRDAANTGCFEGDPLAAMDGCPLPAGALHPCTVDADCTTPGYASCEQRNQGAFRQGGAASAFEVGAPAGSMIDGAVHNSTLVSVFCIPPTFNPAVDAAADLPGPGAVSLVGHAQLQP